MNKPIAIPAEICGQDRGIWSAWTQSNPMSDLETLAIMGFYVAIKKSILDCSETDMDFFGLVLAQFLNTQTVWARVRLVRAYWTFANQQAGAQHD